VLKLTSLWSGVLSMSLTLAACAPWALAGTDAPAYGSITFDDGKARATFDAYLAFLESDGATFASELATVERLRRSEVEYRVRMRGAFERGIEGELTTDGRRVFISISAGGDAGGKGVAPYACFSQRSCLAHELEHARQFDAGELAFVKNPGTGQWQPAPGSYDVGDEVKAWSAQLTTATENDLWRRSKASGLLRGSLLRQFASARTDRERAGVLLGAGYTNLNPAANQNVVFRSEAGYNVGQLLRPDEKRPFFGRVFAVLATG
jgi:hypothetical protein